MPKNTNETKKAATNFDQTTDSFNWKILNYFNKVQNPYSSTYF